MSSFNKVILMGNLTRDPELSYTPSGVAVCKLGLAMNESYVKDGKKIDKPVFVDIICWKNTAENVAKYQKKGMPILVEGRLTLDQWEKDGQKRSKLKIVAIRVVFLNSLNKGAEGSGRGLNAPCSDSLPQNEDNLTPCEEEDSIPF